MQGPLIQKQLDAAIVGLQRLNAYDPTIKWAFTALGGLWVAYQVSKLASWASFHFLSGSRLSRYRVSPEGDAAWAIVTGSSDGIGKGFAEELCNQGFNVVLHGRNEKKLQSVKADLEKAFPQRQIRYVVFDAGRVDDWAGLDGIAAQVQDLDLRVLINNVAGMGSVTPLWAGLEKRSSADVREMFDINARFPTEFTRVLLPTLTKRKESTLIINIGSGASELPTAYLGIYSGLKAYNMAWSRCLGAELKAGGHNVEVLGFLVGMVQSGSEAERKVTFTVPSSRQFAKACLCKVGCGRDISWPYWPHEFQYSFVFGSMPEWLRKKAVMGIVVKEKALWEAKEARLRK